MTLLSTVNASTSSTVVVDTTFDSTYDSYVIMATNVTPTNNNVKLKCDFKINGAYTTGSNYVHRNNSYTASAGYSGTSSNGGSYFELTNPLSTASGRQLNFNFYISQPTLTTKFHAVNWSGSYVDGNQYGVTSSGIGFNAGLGALTGIRFLMTGGSILTGAFRLYGVIK